MVNSRNSRTAAASRNSGRSVRRRLRRVLDAGARPSETGRAFALAGSVCGAGDMSDRSPMALMGSLPLSYAGNGSAGDVEAALLHVVDRCLLHLCQRVGQRRLVLQRGGEGVRVRVERDVS